jgi:hypothetical protein
MQAQGMQVELLPLEGSGDRLFGLLARIRVDAIDCIVKIVGAQLPDDHPDFLEAFIRQKAVEQELEGLKGATGLTPRLHGEIVAAGQTVGVLRGFVEGLPLVDAVRSGQIEFQEAMQKAITLAYAINERGFRIWDCEPSNLWLKPDGEVILIEGQCLISYSDEDRRNLKLLDGQRSLVETMLSEVSSDPRA